MTREWMITSYQNHICSCIYEDSKLMELEVLDSGHEQKVTLGNIYVGRVQNIVKNLNAAFVEIEKGLPCYYSLNENTPIFLKPKNTDKLVIGDEILVQVSKEALKQKAPTVSSDLQITGNYVVVLTGDRTIGVSKKIAKNEAVTTLKREIHERLPEGFGVILRTNAADVEHEVVLYEFEALLAKLQEIIALAKYKTVFSCLYQAESRIQQIYHNINNHELAKITTDDPEIYREISGILSSKTMDTLVLYEEKLQPLYALYRLDRDFKEAVNKQVWLKSGAYLVIEQTEAMVVIDVNTGKAINKKAREEHFLKVNIEAMTEIARQLRLRNLSGIIMIDFIDMEEASSKQTLVSHIKQVLLRDRIPTKYIDMTKLNLVELTRKKVQKSLLEQLR